MESASQGTGCPDRTSSVTRVVAALLRSVGDGRVCGDATLFACPVHGDDVPTLTVRANPRSHAVELHCAVGCPQSEILSAVGLTAADLLDIASPDTMSGNAFPLSREPIHCEGTYTYLDSDGSRLGQVVYSGNGEPPRRRVWNRTTARWANDTGTFGPVLYQLPEVAKVAGTDTPVWIVGDEADARLISEQTDSAVATCALGGWAAFGIEHVAQLPASSRVIVVADRTQDGYRHAERVRMVIAAAAPSMQISVVEPAVGVDLGQHFAAGRTLADVVAIDPARQLTAPADPGAPVPAAPSLRIAPPTRPGGRGGGHDDEEPNRGAIYVHRHGQTVQVRKTRRRGEGEPSLWYEVVWLCEVRVRKITYQDLAGDPDAPRIPGSWEIELRRRLVDDTGHFVADNNSIDGFAYETATTTIAAEEFHTPGWPDLLPWAGVVASETPGGRAKARSAALAVSGIRTTTPAFAATGWRETNGSAIYVHPGGAIGDSGDLMGDVTLDLPARFAPMAMESPVPVDDDEVLAHAVRHGLDPLLTELPADIASPLIGYAFRTFLGKPRGSVHLMGAPGTGKTVAARVCGMSWTSTSFHEHGHTSLFTGGDKMDDSMRALALLMHAAKDTLVLVDEFKGKTAQERVNALHTLFWNGAERSVSTTRGQIRRSSGPPRCGLVTTGEVGSVGSSATRTLTLAINRDVVSNPVTVWSELESAGARAWRAKIGASFIQWLAADHEAKLAAAQRYGSGLATLAWQQFCGTLLHTDGLAGRLVAIAADITVGWAVLLQFLLDQGAMTQDRADQVWRWAMGGLADQLRAQDHSVGDGAEQLLTKVREALTSGAGHATDRATGDVPTPGISGGQGPTDHNEVARAFGWVSRGPRAEGAPQSWSPRGNHLGVVDSSEGMIYLFPGETLATMSAMASRQGEHFTSTSATITSSLGRRGWLGVESDGTRRTRIRIAGVLTSVWPVPLSAFYGDDTDGSDGDGRGPGPRYPLPPWGTRPRIVPQLPAEDQDLTGDSIDVDDEVPLTDNDEGGLDPMTQEMLDFSMGAEPLPVVHENVDPTSAVAAAEPDAVPTVVAVDDPVRVDDPVESPPGVTKDATAPGPVGEPAETPTHPTAPGDNAPATESPAGDTDAPKPVALRPLPESGPDAERWLYAAATITGEAMILPDGDTTPLTFGFEEDRDVRHLGDLADLAAAMHMGHGGGKTVPEPPQLLLTADMLAQFGIVFPPLEELVKLPDPFAVVAKAGEQLIKATVAAGWQTKGSQPAGTPAQGASKGKKSPGPVLRPWMKIWQGQKAAEFVLLPVSALTDPHSGLLAGDAEPVDLAYRMHRVAELLGTTYSSSGAITGRRLYERLHPPGGRALTPTEIVMPPAPFNNPRRMAAGTLMWIRPLTSDERQHTYIHSYDLRANYLTAMGKAIMGMGAPVHHPDGCEFNPKIAALWLISRANAHYPGFIDKHGGHTMLPDITVLAGNSDYDTGWYSTPIVKYLATELDYPIEIHEAYTWPTSRRLLESWTKAVNAGRVAIHEHLAEYPADTNARAIKGGFKAIYTGFHGRFSYGGDCDDKGRPQTPWHRPDWRMIDHAEANVDLHRKVRRIADATGRFPIAVLTDEVFYTSNDPNPVSAKPKAPGADRPDPMPLGIGLGQWDLSRSHELTDEIIAAAEGRNLGQFSSLIPKDER